MLKKLSKCHIDKMVCLINKSAEKYEPIAKSYHSPFITPKEISEDLQTIEFYGYFERSDLIGLMGLQPVEEDLALIRNAYILPAFQRKGIGSLLIKHLESLAEQYGMTKLLVGTYAKASWAINFYIKQGYKTVEDSQSLLLKYWNQLPYCHREESVVLQKALKVIDLPFDRKMTSGEQ